MVTLGLHAKAECDEPGCVADFLTKLFLLATGGLAFQLKGAKGWQVSVTQNGEYITHGPKHSKQVIQPAGPMVIQ
jgi:hypothetical protein